VKNAVSLQINMLLICKKTRRGGPVKERIVRVREGYRFRCPIPEDLYR